MAWFMLLMALALAYSNGANDVSKSIATLVGAGSTSYRAGITWGTIWTGVGAVASTFLATEMLKTFSAWVKPGVTVDVLFPISVAIGAMLWVFLAERLALPVSTTHALVGAICGVAAFAYGVDSVAWVKLTSKIVVPLALSPVLGLVISFGIMPIVKRVFSRHPVTPMVANAVVNRLHWLSSGLIAFSRALNDTPKLVALPILFYTLAPAAAVPSPVLFLLLGLAMCAGSLINGQRVTRTMAEKVTKLRDEEGLAANLTTSALVAAAARFGLPVSTTHVSNGAIIGVGLSQGAQAISWKTVRDFLLAWVVTVPTSAALGVAAYVIGGLFHH